MDFNKIEDLIENKKTLALLIILRAVFTPVGTIAKNQIGRLEKFPTNSGIYIGLLKHSVKLEKLRVIDEINSKGLSDCYLLAKVIEILISYELWDDIDILRCKIIENNVTYLEKSNVLFQLACS